MISIRVILCRVGKVGLLYCLYIRSFDGKNFHNKPNFNHFLKRTTWVICRATVVSVETTLLRQFRSYKNLTSAKLPNLYRLGNSNYISEKWSTWLAANIFATKTQSPLSPPNIKSCKHLSLLCHRRSPMKVTIQGYSTKIADDINDTQLTHSDILP